MDWQSASARLISAASGRDRVCREAPDDTGLPAQPQRVVGVTSM